MIILKTILKVIVVASFILFPASCQKENAIRTAPILPPVESVKVDLSTFTLTPTKADGHNEYFQYVVESIIANWNTIYEQIINIPVQGFEALVNIQPVQQGDGVWMWQCEVKDDFTTYTIYLLGKEKPNLVDWELAVSSEGLFTLKNFIWLTGTSSKDGRQGEWKVVAGPADLISPTDVAVTSNWERDADHRISRVEITYELTHQCCGIDPFYHKSRITWMATATDPAYDHSINAYYNHMGLGWWQADVEWSSGNGCGRVMCSSKWKDGDWHAWPALLNE